MTNVNVSAEKKGKRRGFLYRLRQVVLGAAILLVVLTAGAIYQAIASARDEKTYKPVDQVEESWRVAQDLLGRHLWARGYFVASSGNVTDEIIAVNT